VKETDIAVVGGGPAGLCAAATAAQLGARVVLVDDNPRLGGQLIKQTHKFFGSKSHHCGTRGMDIVPLLEAELRKSGASVLLNTSVVGCFDGNILGLATQNRFTRLRFRSLVVATGAAENTIPFPGCDLPGVYGAGAVQTLMNLYGVRPGERVLMVGSGNIGLIVSYQLIQAGVAVTALVEALPHIGGYHVHAAKLARLGVPILTSHTVKAAHGTSRVSSATICRVDQRFRPVPGTERRLRLDTVCLAVGLTPLVEILHQLDCRMVHMPELGGSVAWHDENLQTSRPGVYVAGDVSGIEEASTAMLEGRLAGAHAAARLTGRHDAARSVVAQARAELCAIRQGTFGDRAAVGKARLAECAQPGPRG
jgi:sarcosine oxidase subunit alpha